jgi:2-polyprenyl-3-methyl-5-hydroxy-6-metoxy-1,4-benzoquinol methylase
MNPNISTSNEDPKSKLLKYYSMGWELEWVTGKVYTINNYKNRMNQTIGMINESPQSEFTILDIGCGAGLYSFELLNRFPKCNLTGFDISEKQVKFINEKIPSDLKNRAKFMVLDAETFELGKIFNYVICTEVLEHILDPNRVLDRVNQHTNINSKIILSVPTIHETGQSGWFYRQKVDSKTVETQDITKIRKNKEYYEFYHKEYTFKELSKILRRNNIVIHNVEYCNFNLKNKYLNAAYSMASSSLLDRALNNLTLNRRASNITVLCGKKG